MDVDMLSEHPRDTLLTRSDYGRAILVGVAALTVYVATLAPGMLRNDSGEFQVLATTLGNTHPTGYPVYLLLGKLATLIPAGNAAYRVNLLSAICGAVTVSGVCLLGQILSGYRWLPLVGGLVLCVSPIFWSQSIIAEIYVPATVCMVVVLLGLALWQRTQQVRWLFTAALAGGLSLGIHASVSLMAPFALLFLGLRRNGWRLRLCVATAGAHLGVVLTLAAFWFIDWHDPPSNYFRAIVSPSRSEWNLASDDLDSFAERLFFSLSARQYHAKIGRQSVGAVLLPAADYLRNLCREFPLLWLVLAIIGSYVLYRRNRRFALLMVAIFGAHLVYVLTYARACVHVSYIPTHLLIAVWGVLGCGLCVELTKRWLSHRERLRGRPGRAELFWTGLVSLAILWPMLRTDAWTAEGRRAVWAPEGEPPFEVDYSCTLHERITAIVNGLEDDAVVFTPWAIIYPCYYVTHIEQGRTDMVFVQWDPAIGQTRLAQSALEYIQENAKIRPVYLIDPYPESEGVFSLEPVMRGGFKLYRIRQPLVPKLELGNENSP